MAVQRQPRNSSNNSSRRTDRRRRRLSLESLENRLVLHGAESVSPFNGEADVAVNVNVVATFDFDADPATVNDSTFELRDPQGTLIPAAVSYDAPSRTATLNPDQNLADVADYYEARIVGGPSGVYELGGSELEEDLTWYFITQPPTYSDTAVFTGLVNPTAIEFAPDGSVFVAEKGGLVKVYDDLNDTTPTTFADLRINVHNYWDRGLLGLAVHPDYPATPEVFVLYTYDAPLSGSVAAPAWGTGGGTGDPGPGTTGDPSSVSGRLSRLVANGSGVWDGIEHVLIEDWGQQYPSHSVGSIAFGADGALYASGGDGASFNFADYGQNDGLLDDDPALGDTRLLDPVDEGGALRSLDLRTSPEDPNVDPVSLDGTIIRIDPATGNPLPDNPLYDLYGAIDDPNAERIVADGLRNPFRFTVRPGTNEVWVGDVGWGQWEEINVVRNPTDTQVDGFGWPAFEGAAPSSYDALDIPLLEDYYGDVANNPSLHSEPFYTYRHNEPVLPGGPTGNSSIAGLAFAEGGNLNRARKRAVLCRLFTQPDLGHVCRSRR